MAVPVVAAAMALVSIPAAGAAPHAAPAHGVAAPVAVGTLQIAGTARDGAQVRADGLRWHPGPLKPGQTLLSFQVGYEWRACDPADGSCRMGSDSTATPFAAARYVVGHRDVGRRLRLVETATEVIETDPATFTFRVVRASRRVTSPEIVSAFARGRAPTLEFLNGLPEKTTGSNAENFQVTLPHFNTADGRPAMQYRIDDRRWRTLRPTRVFGTGELGLGDHHVTIRAQNRAGATTRTYGWRVVPLPAPAACIPRESQPCWYPPHDDSTGRPMRWDWQIGRVTPLERTGTDAVDFYDIDGFLTTPAEVNDIHTAWQASTLPHPKTACYLDLAWENYRPDGSTIDRGGAFPASTLGRIYYGYPNERWVDFRQLDALKPMLDARIAMCAAKGFDSVELDDIDSFDPPSTTGFRLTAGDAQNYLAWAFNDIHRHGMTALWKNSGLLSWWGRNYTDGAVVEECYTYGGCFSSQLAGSTQYGWTCTAVTGPTPCGYDGFTTQTTAHQPNGKWVGEDEYQEDSFVCAPGESCSPPRRLYSTYCEKVWAPAAGFSALRMTDELDGSVFQPCPTGE